MSLNDLYLARPAVGINTREFFQLESKLERYLRSAADGQGVANPAEALQHAAHQRGLCEKPDSDWPGFFDENELEAEPEDDFFSVLSKYLVHHVGGSLHDIDSALWRLLPYGVYIFDGCVHIFSRRYTPTIRIDRDSVSFVRFPHWIEHERSRYFALGDTRKSNLRDRAEVLEIITTELRGAELVSERLDRSITYAGDFRQLTRRLLSDAVSYLAPVASRAA